MDAREAADRLRAGELVALPTETVYGLAADAHNPEAVRRIFELKGRPADHPLIVHLGEGDWASRYGQLPPAFKLLADRFWPGPLTMVVPATPAVHRLITGGQDTVALRVPRHPLTLEVLQRLERAVVAPSANRFGHTSPTTAEHVRGEFPSLPVLDGGPCPVGLESTILDLTGPPRILRPGQLSRGELEAILGPIGKAPSDQRSAGIGKAPSDQRSAGIGEDGGPLPRVPGALDRHYAPRTPTRWWTGEAQRSPWGFLGFASVGATLEVILPATAEGYANGLYAGLRQLDEGHVEVILVQPPPQSAEWEAIWDRLRRAIQS